MTLLACYTVCLVNFNVREYSTMNLSLAALVLKVTGNLAIRKFRHQAKCPHHQITNNPITEIRSTLFSIPHKARVRLMLFDRLDEAFYETLP